MASRATSPTSSCARTRSATRSGTGKVTFTETNHVFIDYTYAASYKIPGVKTDEWKHTVADNRLDLVPTARRTRSSRGCRSG